MKEQDEDKMSTKSEDMKNEESSYVFLSYQKILICLWIYLDLDRNHHHYLEV